MCKRDGGHISLQSIQQFFAVTSLHIEHWNLVWKRLSRRCKCKGRVTSQSRHLVFLCNMFCCFLLFLGDASLLKGLTDFLWRILLRRHLMFPDHHPEVQRDIAARSVRPERGRPMDWDLISKLLGSWVVCPKCGVLNC